MKPQLPKKIKLSAAQFPALAEFLPGYLHEDFRSEYASAAEALGAFCREASGEEIRALAAEWKRFRKISVGKGLPEVQSALQTLGGAWLPQSEADLVKFDEGFENKQ